MAERREEEFVYADSSFFDRKMHRAYNRHIMKKKTEEEYESNRSNEYYVENAKTVAREVRTGVQGVRNQSERIGYFVVPWT